MEHLPYQKLLNPPTSFLVPSIAGVWFIDRRAKISWSNRYAHSLLIMNPFIPTCLLYTSVCVNLFANFPLLHFMSKHSHAHHMGITCTPHGYHMYTTWASHAYHMRITWTPHGDHKYLGVGLNLFANVPSIAFHVRAFTLFSTFCRIALKKILHKNKHNLYIFVSTSVDFLQICRKEKIYIFGSCNITLNLFKSWESINCTKTQIYLTLLFHSENFHSTIICPHTYIA